MEEEDRRVRKNTNSQVDTSRNRRSPREKKMEVGNLGSKRLRWEEKRRGRGIDRGNRHYRKNFKRRRQTEGRNRFAPRL